MQQLDLSIIICTRGRAGSLQMTLQRIAATDRPDINLELVIVDNGSVDNTPLVVQEMENRLPIRYIFEPTHGQYGKSHALNRALSEGGLAPLIAVLDDDMSVEPSWCRGVMSISRRWPDADLFTGRTYVVWPDSSIPAWANQPEIQGWLFSIEGCGNADHPLRKGHWFTGGHFWFRSRVLKSGLRFADIWATEPCFMLRAVAQGASGIRAPDAAAGHRVQRELLEPSQALRRARQVGEAFAELRMDPEFGLKHSRLSLQHPLFARAYVANQRFRWRLLAGLHSRVKPSSPRFGSRLVACEREASFRRIAQILRRQWHPFSFRRKRNGNIPALTSSQPPSMPGQLRPNSHFKP